VLQVCKGMPLLEFLWTAVTAVMETGTAPDAKLHAKLMCPALAGCMVEAVDALYPMLLEALRAEVRHTLRHALSS
jgi:hypothetical protein